MRKWLARKLFNLAVRLDWEGSAEAARIIIAVEDSWMLAFAPKKKRGRPAGRKDSVAGVAPKKIGRPLGSKDKNPRNTKRMGRPLGSKNKPKVQT